MDTSIYIGTQALQAVCGAAGKKGIVITDYASIPLPEGALINGVITDEQAVAGAVQALVRQHPTLPMKAVQLTLDSSLIYFKQALLPNLPKHKMQALVAGEFADVEGANELLCDYAVLERNGEQGGVNALLSAVKRDLVGSYLELFSSLGITLSGLNTAECRVHLFSLVCSEETLRQRLAGDIARGLRDAGAPERSLPRLKLYRRMPGCIVDTDGLTAEEVAAEIARAVEGRVNK